MAKYVETLETTDAVTSVVSGLKNSVAPSFSPLESLRFLKQNDGSYIMVTDLYLLLNSERIRNTLGDDTYRAIVSSMASSPTRNDLSSPSLSDNLKLDTVKSRFLQSLSEIQAWVSNLTTRASDLDSKIKLEQEVYIESQKLQNSNLSSNSSDIDK